jgi:hypothetical protein
MQGLGAGEVQHGFVDREGLHERGEGQHQLADLPRETRCIFEIRTDHRRLGQSLERLNIGMALCTPYRRAT